MADENNAQAVEAWKQKYYDSLEQAERKEKEWKRVDDLLRRAIQRLTLAADGLDETLDGQLRNLRDAIRDNEKPYQLEASIEAMSATLVKLDSKRRARAALTAPDVMESLLEKVSLPRTHSKSLKDLKKQARDAQEEQIPSLINDFIALLGDALHAETPTTSESGAGLFGKLFSRKEGAPRSEIVEPVSELRSDDKPAPADHTPGQRDMLLHLLEQLARRGNAAEIFKDLRDRVMRARTEQELKHLADMLAGGLSGSSSSSSAPVSLPVEESTEARTAEIADDGTAADVLDDDVQAPRQVECDFRDALVQLLERLAMPANFEARVDALKEKLEDDSAPLESDTVLCEMADLVSEMRIEIQREKNDLEEFLQQLTSRLQDIDSVVQGAETKRAASFENGRELGNKVQAQILGIESSVRNVEEMDQLKAAVKLNIDAIISHVEEHRKVEEQRNQEVESEVQALRKRLAELEQESEDLRSKVHQERNQAMTDALTGVPNRLAWDERIIQEYARWKRFQTPLALLVWDVDHFKNVNDEYGHKAGDKVLKVIATLLQDNIRETDFLARYGGEEFVLLMTGAQENDVAAVAEKLRKAIEECGFHYKGQEVPITISCGRTLFHPGDSIEAAFERADQALYRAKELGRNQCVCAEDGA